MADRKEELLDLIENDAMLIPTVIEIVRLEQVLDEVGQLPFYKVNPNNHFQQKLLPAFKIYKETLQQYTNCIKLLCKSKGLNEEEEESLLRMWVAGRMKDVD